MISDSPGRVQPDWGVPLLAGDYDTLASSWITREFADGALLRRVSAEQGREIVGQKGKRDCAGLLIPYYLPGENFPHSFRVRRDKPEHRLDMAGKLKQQGKYLGAPGCANRLYFPTSVTVAQLADPSIAIVITEGEKKAIALHRLALFKSDVPRFIPIALAGVWSWRGNVGKAGGPNGERVDVKGVLNDFGRIDWKARSVLILFDVNVHSNEDVRRARDGLSRELTSRHAAVQFVELPPDCGVNGVDDLLAVSGPEQVLALFDKPIDGKRLHINLPSQYHQRAEGIFRVNSQTDRLTETQLTNYQAAITGHISLDDGVETKGSFEIEAALNGRSFRFAVPSSQFFSKEWPMHEMGPNAITYPNQWEYARTAIQTTAVTAKERRVYVHTGWREINSQQCFLHGAGAIGPDGIVSGVDVQLPELLTRYRLGLPQSKDALQYAVRASLLLLQLGQPIIMFPLIASVVRSIFGTSDFALHLVGETGAFKSELAALAQQFFGKEMSRLHLPGGWSSSANSLEMLTFYAKDVLVVVDDFAPQGSTADVARYHASADRVFRAAGNGAGRNRLDSSARLREPKPPRGLILSTGEEVPRGHSVCARLLILEIEKGSINSQKLSECQKAAGNGVYAEFMGAFVRWVAGQPDRGLQEFTRRATGLRLRASAVAGHARTPDIVAGLQASFELLVQFCQECEAIDATYAADLIGSSWKALTSAAAAQAKHHQAVEPVARYVEILKSCLASGQAHLASRLGGHPETFPESCGWRSESGTWVPKGPGIGWIDGDAIYLEPLSAYRVVQKASNEAGEGFPLSEQTLKRRLREKGWLASVDKARETNTVRRNIAGSEKSVLHLRSSLLLPQTADESVQSAELVA